MKERKHPWQKAWRESKFDITTNQPSVLVKKYGTKLGTGNRVLDVGCGKGRNSIYLATKGCEVDTFDVLDPEWINALPDKVKQHINFQQADILEYPFADNKYDAVIVARVIQYLSTKELDFLLDKIASSLVEDGFLLLSFNNKGGIFQREEIEVPKYKYSIKQIEKKLENIFRTVKISEGSGKSKYVNYVDDIQSYDIYAAGLISFTI